METQLVPLEILHGAFVLFGSLARVEGPQVAALAGLAVLLAGIEPVLAGGELADHEPVLYFRSKRILMRPVPALMPIMNYRVAALLAVTVLLGGQAKPDREFTECPECPDMMAIPAGKFLMGSPAHEPGRFDSECPQHVVTIKAFALAKYPVTSAEFLAFLNATGYQPQPCNPLLGLGWRQLK